MNLMGDSGEQQAVTFLEKQHVRILKRNFRSKYGEIDIIAQEGMILCFIEVRCRTRSDYGTPQETIVRSKQRKIIKTAQYYLQNQSLSNEPICRFDVIAILADQSPEWIKNAFQ